MAWNPYQYQAYQYPPQLQGTQMSLSNQPMMTPPTIHAEIVQVDGEQAAAAYPVGAGSSQMMIAKDDSAIFVKSASANGFTLDVYERRARSAQGGAFDPSEYVRRDELETLVYAALAAQKHGKREATDESV